MAYGTEKAKEKKKDISKLLQLFLFFFFSQLCSGTCIVCLQQLRAKDPWVFISAAFLQRMWIPLLYLRLLQIFNLNRFFFFKELQDQGFSTACGDFCRPSHLCSLQICMLSKDEQWAAPIATV